MEHKPLFVFASVIELMRIAKNPITHAANLASGAGEHVVGISGSRKGVPELVWQIRKSEAYTIIRFVVVYEFGMSVQPCNVLRLSLFRMRCCRPVSRCGHAIPVPRALAPVTRCYGSAAVFRKRGRVPRAVAETELTQSGELKANESGHVSNAYPFADIEKKWQCYWDDNSTFRTPHEVDTSKPKYYVLDMFPYPRCALLSYSACEHQSYGTVACFHRV